ncbi:phytanoyl-CoA dioxygenase [Fulvivirga sp. RKSG066]|uniref:phytanoyl-CoA dioxygenase family protein n=1 Tax=Fulvivirga aurantia TaxID=2529383 RepID=UPI0012BD4241|nr:phytanoyl-CoA dioxygenase family protein [Fulvivirga aurantia]MTI22437.1 phytanoyl-CoA dioxygenase [Fulvivirga aurantia]
MQFNLQIDNQRHTYDIKGDFKYGDAEVLIDSDKNAIEHVDWFDHGYNNIRLLTESEFVDLKTNLLQVLNDILHQEGITQLTQLEDYHNVTNTSEKHQKVIEKTRQLTKEHFNINLNAVCARVSEILKKEVQIFNPKLEQEIITLRISRPQSLDINPLHRDAYLDFYKDTINLWIPIAGCNEQSSLPVIPGSHTWNESQVLRTEKRGAKIQGLTYNVPGIVEGPRPLKAIRPNPDYGEALIFSPYLVHGSAINQNPNTTRMALELRPCLK